MAGQYWDRSKTAAAGAGMQVTEPQSSPRISCSRLVGELEIAWVMQVQHADALLQHFHIEVCCVYTIVNVLDASHHILNSGSAGFTTMTDQVLN